jgi:hypothetical protein
LGLLALHQKAQHVVILADDFGLMPCIIPQCWQQLGFAIVTLNATTVLRM